jgi:hypothetical protein
VWACIGSDGPSGNQTRTGHSGYSKILGWVIQVIIIQVIINLGFRN